MDKLKLVYKFLIKMQYIVLVNPYYKVENMLWATGTLVMTK